ncbi:MAG TPA: response regulator [Steroidobacteraceae bacterium]|nr:response regulator [Steroidobacteraceae bacterium]
MTTRSEAIRGCGGPEHRVCIVDDDDGYRLSIHRLLQACGFRPESYRCAGEYLLAEHRDVPSCILLDMCMPGPTGLELFSALAARGTAPPVIFVTASNDVTATVHAMKSGAVGFLTKPVERERLVETVHHAVALDVSRRAARDEVEQLRDRYLRLSECERIVFAGVISGKLNKQLAVTLGICERSIKSYRARVLQKLGVSSIADLVRTAKRLDLPEYRPVPRGESVRYHSGEYIRA